MSMFIPVNLIYNMFKTKALSTQRRNQDETEVVFKKVFRPNETARNRWRGCSTYAGPVSGAVLPPQNTPKAANKTDDDYYYYYIILLLLLMVVVEEL